MVKSRYERSSKSGITSKEIYDSPFFIATEETILFCQLFFDYTKLQAHKIDHKTIPWETCTRCIVSLPKVSEMKLKEELVSCQEKCNFTPSDITDIKVKLAKIENMAAGPLAEVTDLPVQVRKKSTKHPCRYS